MNLDMSGAEKALGSFAGIAAVVVAIVGGLKALFPGWVKGKEPALALVAAYVLTVLAKASGILAAHWLTLAYLPILIAVGAQLGHDKFLSIVKLRSGGAK